MEARVTLAALYTRHDAQEWRRALRRVFFAKRNGLGSDDPMRPTLTEDGLALLREIQSDCLGRFSEVWKGLDKTQKAEHWQRLALWLLRNSPEHMLEFLLVTTQGLERPLFKMITDCFHFLETFHLDELGTWRKGGHTFRSILQTSLHPETWPVAVLPQAGVRLYTRWGDYETIVLAFDTMWRRKSQISAVLALIFMRDFTYYHDVKRAMKALWLVFKLKQPGFGMNSTSVNRHCCKLLTLDTVKDGPDGRNFRILPKLLQMGVNPTLPMMNILLSNAFKTGDPQMGFDMLQFMKSQGFEFDKYTYMEMLKDGVAREDRAQVQSVVAEILQNEELQRNPLLLNKIFHAHYAFTAKHMESNADPAEVFYSVLSMYNKLHDIKPLKELTIIPPHYEPPSGSGDTQPSLVPLYVMIATYLRCQRRIPVVQRIYSRFRELVKGGHESIAPLAATDHTYNEFLTALRGSPEGLRPSVRIVEDMLQSEPVDIYNGEHKVRRADHAKPTFRTWTILMSAFLYNGHLSAAERVKEMMARYNIPFNDVTWNVIISGYANLQKIPEAAQAIKTMESQGYPIDSYTMKGLRFLKDPERLWSAVEELDRISQDGLGLDENDRNTVADRSQEEDSENVLDQRLQHLKERMSR